MITIKVTKETLEEIEKEYFNFITERNVGYILFAIRTENNIITAYDNKKKTQFKVTIQGDNAMELDKKYSYCPEALPKKQKNEKDNLLFLDVDQQIGSDEVGTGDFFGPVVVCAAYVDHDTMKIIYEYGVSDSKTFSDAKIREIVPLLLKKVHFVCKILSPEKYNNLQEKGCNMNKIKAMMHNYVLLKLHERCPYVKNVYMDQFTPEDKYYEYLRGIVPVILKNIIFREKGEVHFPSVALASCIARYTFLQEIDFLNKKYGVKIPHGAGSGVNAFAKKFIEKFGIEEFKKITKKNFKNYLEVLNETTSLL